MEGWPAQPYTNAWDGRRVLRGFEVRQFEWHPALPAGAPCWWADLVAAGTLDGHVALVDTRGSGAVLGAVRDFGEKVSDPVLGVCWLRRAPGRFVACSLHGSVRLVDAGPALAGGGAPEGAHVPNMPVVANFPQVRCAVGGDRHRLGADDPDHRDPVLTCVHVNCDDSQLVASGYTNHVAVFDMATGQETRWIENAAGKNINITRFSNNHPQLFATSSFDKSVSLWDLRACRGNKPLYSVLSARGNVTLSFDPSDTLLLSAGVDNELNLRLVADGRLAMRLETEETGRADSYTRGYFAAGGMEVVSGSSEEPVVRVQSTLTGATLATVQIYDGRPAGNSLLYVQSLRAHPTRAAQIGVLTNTRDLSHSLQLVVLDRLKSAREAEAEAGAGGGAGGRAGAPALPPVPAPAASWTFHPAAVAAECRGPAVGAVLREEADVSRAMCASSHAFHTAPLASWGRGLWDALQRSLAAGHGGGAAVDATLLAPPAAPLEGGGTEGRVSVCATAPGAVLLARLPLARALAAASGAAAAASGSGGPTLLSLPPACCVTPAMLQVALTFAFTDAFCPPLAPPLRPETLPPLGAGGGAELLPRLLGLTVLEADAAALAALRVTAGGGDEAAGAPSGGDAAALAAALPLAPARGLFGCVGEGATPWLGPLHAGAFVNDPGTPPAWLQVVPFDPFRPTHTGYEETLVAPFHNAPLRANRTFIGPKEFWPAANQNAPTMDGGAEVGGASAPSSPRAAATTPSSVPLAPTPAAAAVPRARWTAGVRGISAAVVLPSVDAAAPAWSSVLAARPLAHGVAEPRVPAPALRETRLLQGVAAALQAARVFGVPRLAFLAVHRVVCGDSGLTELTPTLVCPLVLLALHFGASMPLLRRGHAMGEGEGGGGGVRGAGEELAALAASIFASVSGETAAGDDSIPRGAGATQGDLMSRAWEELLSGAGGGGGDGWEKPQLGPHWATAPAASSLLLCALRFAVAHAPLVAALGVSDALRAEATGGGEAAARRSAPGSPALRASLLPALARALRVGSPSFPAAPHHPGGHLRDGLPPLHLGGHGSGSHSPPRTARRIALRRRRSSAASSGEEAEGAAWESAPGAAARLSGGTTPSLERRGSLDTVEGVSPDAAAPAALTPNAVADALQLLFAGLVTTPAESRTSSAASSPSLAGLSVGAPLGVRLGLSPRIVASAAPWALETRARASSFSLAVELHAAGGGGGGGAGGGGGDGPASASALEPFRRFPVDSDPLFDTSCAGFVPRTVLHQMVLVGAWSVTGAPSFHTRALLIGGSGLALAPRRGDDTEAPAHHAKSLPLHSLLSLTAGALHGPDATAPHGERHPNERALWFKQEAGGAGSHGVPHKLEFHSAAPLAPGAPRYTIVFPGYTIGVNDYGPGSMPSLAPYFAPARRKAAWDGAGVPHQAAAAALDTGGGWVPSALMAGFRSADGGELELLPGSALPGNLQPAAALAWCHSRVYLLDSWTGAWTAVNPAFSVKGLVGMLPHGEGTFSSLQAAGGIAIGGGGGSGGGGGRGGGATPVESAPVSPLSPQDTKRMFAALPCPMPRSNFSSVLWESGDSQGCCENLPRGPAAGLPVPVRELPPPGGAPVVCYLHHVLFGGILQSDVFRTLLSEELPERQRQEYSSELHVCVTRVETFWAPAAAPGTAVPASLQQHVTLEWQAPAVRGSPGNRAAHAAAMVALPLEEGGPAMVAFGGVGYTEQLHGHLFLLALDGPAVRYAAAAGEPEVGGGGAMLAAGWARELGFAWQEPICLGTAPPPSWGHTLTPLHTILSPPVDGSAFAPAELCSRSLALFGGTETRPQGLEQSRFNDVFLLTLSKPAAAGVYVASWSKPFIGARPRPSPRERHAAFYAPAWTATHWSDAPKDDSVRGAIVVFGGHGDGYQDEDEEEDHFSEEDEEGSESSSEESESEEEGDEEDEDEDPFPDLEEAAAASADEQSQGVDGAACEPPGAQRPLPPVNALLHKHLLFLSTREAGRVADLAKEALDLFATTPPTDEHAQRSLSLLLGERHPFTPDAFQTLHDAIAALVGRAPVGRALGGAGVSRELERLVQHMRQRVVPDAQQHYHAAPFRSTRTKLLAVDSRAWALHLAVERGPAGDPAWVPLALQTLPAADLKALLAAALTGTAVRCAAAWRRVPAAVLDSGPMPMPPVPSSSLARDLLALVPAGPAFAAASAREQFGGEHREAALEAAVRAALRGGGSGPAPRRHPALRFSDFSLRLGPHSLPTNSWLLRAASPLFSAVVAECEAADRGAAAPRSRSMQLALLGPEEDAVSPAGAVSLTTAVRLLAYASTGAVLLTPAEPTAAMALLAAAEELAMHELAWAAEACLVSCVGDASVFGLLQWADSFLAAQMAGAEEDLRREEGGATAATGSGGGGGGGCAARPAALPPPAPLLRSLRREGRTGALLRAACLSHLLREFARLREHEDFAELPHHLQEEARRMYASEGHAYLGDYEAASPRAIDPER
jgi:hypothetical protein